MDESIDRLRSHFGLTPAEAAMGLPGDWAWRGLKIFWTPARQIRIDKDAINTGASGL
jgi:hypothetical protein